MLILGIETSGLNCSVALLREQELLAQQSLMFEGKPQTNRLPLVVQALCAEAGIPLDMIELLAVNRGPGSFTGLRVGLVFAKTFAYVQKCQLKGVETFPATVENLPACEQIVEVVEDLRQGHVAWQQFRWTDSGWKAITGLVAEEISFWAARSHDQLLLTGGGLERLQKLWPGKVFPQNWQILPPDQRYPDAIAVARLAFREYQKHGPDDPFSLTPLYVRRSAAEERLAAQKR